MKKVFSLVLALLMSINIFAITRTNGVYDITYNGKTLIQIDNGEVEYYVNFKNSDKAFQAFNDMSDSLYKTEKTLRKVKKNVISILIRNNKPMIFTAYIEEPIKTFEDIPSNVQDIEIPSLDISDDSDDLITKTRILYEKLIDKALYIIDNSSVTD